MNKDLFIKKIAEDNNSVEPRTTYSLYEISLYGDRKYYAVEISHSQESEFAVIGKDIESAKSLYCSICNSYTMPVNLFEIISDKIQSMKY